MIFKILVLIIIFLIILFYELYLKDYFKVKKIFSSLKGFLDTRDALVLKLVPELKESKNADKVVFLIDERKENFKTSYNNSIKADAKLNSELRKLYDEINKLPKNDVINSVFGKIINLEKDLKKIRNEYTKTVEKYNNNLIKHKYICLKLIRMKPLDTYTVKK